jgi:hypothetical protein
MRRSLLFLPAMLAACATASPPPAPAEPVPDTPQQPVSVHGVTPGHTCRTQGTENFVGQTADSSSGPAILRASSAAVLRWAPPGVMLTMDYREDRVTVFLGSDNKITAIKCG